MFDLADFTMDALPDATPKGFEPPPRTEKGIFCMLAECVNHNHMESMDLTQVTTFFFFFFQKQVMQLALIYIWVNQVRAQITGEPELYRDLENDNNKNNI